MDHFSHPAGHSLVLFLLYLLIWLIVSSFSPNKTTLAIPLRNIDFRFSVIGPYGVFYASMKRDSVSLLRILFLSYVQVFSWATLPVFPLNYAYFYFPFLFLGFYFSVYSYVANAVSCHSH